MFRITVPITQKFTNSHNAIMKDHVEGTLHMHIPSFSQTGCDASF